MDKIQMSKVSNIPSAFQGKYKQAVSTKTGRSWSDSSSGECEDKVLAHKAEWAKETELREFRDEVKRLKKNGGNRVCSSRKLVKEAGSKKDIWRWMKQLTATKELQKQLRDIEKFTDVPQEVGDVLKEKWQQELQDKEHRRNDLLPEHQKVAEEVAQVAESTGQKETVPEELGQMG